MSAGPASTHSLDGTVAVVIGATRGIGKGIAIELAAAGSTVYVVGRTAAASPTASGSVEQTMAAIAECRGRGVAAVCDATADIDLVALFERVAHDSGRLDVLVNCVFESAQFVDSIGKRFWELPPDHWDRVVDLGARTAYAASVCAAPLLFRGGRGLIVNVSARGAERYRYNVAYGVGKAALDRMTRDMAKDLNGEQVAVVSIWPGTTRTEHIDAAARESGPLTAFGDVREMETPRYAGRVVVGLAADPHVLDKTGQRFWVAELAAGYGIVDEYGHAHEAPT